MTNGKATSANSSDVVPAHDRSRRLRLTSLVLGPSCIRSFNRVMAASSRSYLMRTIALPLSVTAFAIPGSGKMKV